MSVEENKKVHQRMHEELWMKHNVDVIDELTTEDVNLFGAVGRVEVKKRFQNHIANAAGNSVVKVEHHAKIGEGDMLAIWQTNHRKDGDTQEGVTIQHYKNGKLAKARWFPAANS